MKMVILRHCFLKVINSPFLLWKFYLDVLAKIVFNYSDNHILPTILPGLNDNCRDHTVCMPFTCFGLKKNKIKEILFEATLKSAKKLVKQSCVSVDSYFIIDVFNTYKQGVEFRNQYLTIERGKDE